MRRTQRGFTVIELLLAISILSLIMSVAYGSLRQLTRSKDVLDDRWAQRRIANSVLTRFTRELQLADTSPVMPPPQSPSTFDSKQYLMGSYARGSGDRSLSSITFVANGGGQYRPDGSAHTGRVQISYRAEEDPEGGIEGSDLLYLVREEVPYQNVGNTATRQEKLGQAYAQRMIFPLTKELRSIRIRYYDGSSWYEDWGANARKLELPQLIEFSIEIESPDGFRETLVSAVAIRSAKR